MMKVPTLQNNMVPVYVLLFQQQGHDLKKWAQLLGNIERYILGRPIYEHEDDAQKVIRIKMSEEQEGYIKLAVAQSAWEKALNMPERMDRYGNRLVSLAAGTAKSEHILEFVHGKKRYHFIEGELVNVSSTTKRN